jgi:hypothetical protein
MLNEFVNMIFIHKSEKNEWDERTQRIDIHFNFIGNFKVPITKTEPTAEETEALMQRRIKLQKQREANKRFREKQKAKIEQEQAGKPA